MTKPKGPEFWDDPTDPRHGTVNGYSNLLCSCEPCRKAWADAHRSYMHRGDNLRDHAERQMVYAGASRQRPYVPRARKNQDGEWVQP
jgi:hypothetical protein